MTQRRYPLQIVRACTIAIVILSAAFATVVGGSEGLPIGLRVFLYVALWAFGWLWALPVSMLMPRGIAKSAYIGLISAIFFSPGLLMGEGGAAPVPAIFALVAPNHIRAHWLPFVAVFVLVFGAVLFVEIYKVAITAKRGNPRTLH